MGLAALTAIGWGQITTSSVVKPITETIIPPYDSSKVFLEYEPISYTGQLLYLPGKHETLRQYGYRDFLIDYTKSNFDDKNKYRKGDYNSLAGCYFKVIEVISPQGKYSNSFLKLEELKTHEICYFKYDPKFRHSFPFIPIAYFNFIKNKYMGEILVTRGKNWFNGTSEPMADMNTGFPVEFTAGTLWRVVDVSIEEKYYNLSLILENDKCERIPFSSFENLPYSSLALLYSDIKPYEGTEEYQMIINGKVKVGFSEKMALLSWGEPKKINRSSHGKDQWVYGDQYLYFEGGKMTSWN